MTKRFIYGSISQCKLPVGEEMACELPASPISRFQNTQYPELRFRAWLTDGAPEVRFERMAAR